MSKLRYYLRQTFAAFIYRKLKAKYYDERVLPKISRAELEGVKLDIAGLDPFVKQVILNGGYEQSEVFICRQMIQPSDKILEFGAAIGFVGLFCRTSLKVSKVISVEPNPETAERLRRNYALNGLEPNLIEAAVAGEDGKVEFQTSSQFWNDSAMAGEKVSATKAIEVQGLSFESILKKANEQFSTIILDIEGSETLLDWSILPPSVSKVIIEIHPDIIGFPSAYGVLKGAMNKGFQVVSQRGQVFGLQRSQTLPGNINQSGEARIHELLVTA